MYFILAGTVNYRPQIQEFSQLGTSEMRSFRNIGSVFTLLSAMPRVLSPQGEPVKSIINGDVVATIDKEGFVYLGLLSSATLSALLIELIYIYTAAKDPRLRVVKVKSEPNYGIDFGANDKLGNTDFVEPVVSNVGIALSSHGRGIHHVCIRRGGTDGERPKEAHYRPRKRKRV